MVDETYIVVLNDDDKVASAQLFSLFLNAGLQKTDARYLARHTRGLINFDLSEEQASQIAEELNLQNIKAYALPESEYPTIIRPKLLSRLEISEQGLWFPTIELALKQTEVAWESITFLAVALQYSNDLEHLPGQQREAIEKKKEELLFSETKIFPLYEYLSGIIEPKINPIRLTKPSHHKEQRIFGFKNKKYQRFAMKKKEQERFVTPHANLEASLYFGAHGELYQLSGSKAVYSQESHPVHWLLAFHQLVQSITAYALSAYIPQATERFVQGSNQADYLFQNDFELRNYLHWLVGQKL